MSSEEEYRVKSIEALGAALQMAMCGTSPKNMMPNFLFDKQEPPKSCHI